MAVGSIVTHSWLSMRPSAQYAQRPSWIVIVEPSRRVRCAPQ
jgi:hypothetical protein